MISSEPDDEQTLTVLVGYSDLTRDDLIQIASSLQPVTVQ